MYCATSFCERENSSKRAWMYVGEALGAALGGQRGRSSSRCASWARASFDAAATLPLDCPPWRVRDGPVERNAPSYSGAAGRVVQRTSFGFRPGGLVTGGPGLGGYVRRSRTLWCVYRGIPATDSRVKHDISDERSAVGDRASGQRQHRARASDRRQILQAARQPRLDGDHLPGSRPAPPSRSMRTRWQRPRSSVTLRPQKRRARPPAASTRRTARRPSGSTQRSGPARTYVERSCGWNIADPPGRHQCLSGGSGAPG